MTAKCQNWKKERYDSSQCYCDENGCEISPKSRIDSNQTTNSTFSIDVEWPKYNKFSTFRVEVPKGGLVKRCAPSNHVITSNRFVHQSFDYCNMVQTSKNMSLRGRIKPITNVSPTLLASRGKKRCTYANVMGKRGQLEANLWKTDVLFDSESFIENISWWMENAW